MVKCPDPRGINRSAPHETKPRWEPAPLRPPVAWMGRWAWDPEAKSDQNYLDSMPKNGILVKPCSIILWMSLVCDISSFLIHVCWKPQFIPNLATEYGRMAWLRQRCQAQRNWCRYLALWLMAFQERQKKMKKFGFACNCLGDSASGKWKTSAKSSMYKCNTLMYRINLRLRNVMYIYISNNILILCIYIYIFICTYIYIYL